MKKNKLILISSFLTVSFLLVGCNESKEFYLEENKEILNNELGENNWEIITSNEVRNGFENPYYNWDVSYKNHKNEELKIKFSSKNQYGLRQNFDKHLTDLFLEENKKLFNQDDFNIKIISVQQTTTYDENEYLKKYKYIYQFNKEIDWKNILSKHHYIRIEMKSVNSNQDNTDDIVNYLNQFDNVEFIYFRGNDKQKLLKMHGEVIDERLLSNQYGDYRGYFLKNKFKY